MWPHRAGRAVAAVLVVLSAFGATALTGVAPWLAAAFALSTGVQALVTAWTFARLRPDGLRLRQTGDVWALVVSGTVGGIATVVLLAAASWFLVGPEPMAVVVTGAMHGVLPC